MQIDAISGSATITVGTQVLDDDWSQADHDQMVTIVNSPEGDLVSRHLWEALVNDGQDVMSKPMAAMAANLTVYEYTMDSPPSADGGCFGCCGPGCWGCTGCYTAAREAHDACVEVWGPTDPICQKLLALAALSAWCCRGYEIPGIC